MRVFGLIGYPLHHSFSKKYFTEKFVREGITDARFENFEIPTIDKLTEVFAVENLHGLAVTIPYKEVVLPYLDELSTEATLINACNCIQIKSGKYTGFNTDYIGFSQSFQKLLQPHHTHALVLGTGGSSKAVQYALKRLGLSYQVVSRTVSNHSITYTAIDEDLLQTYNVIINCTPLGTYPGIEEAPPLPYHLLTEKHYLYDLVYNPALTKFLRLGQLQGATVQNGHDMLLFQAEENWKLWNNG